MTVRNGLPPGIEDKLDEALALLAAGIPLETVLNQAGDDAEALRPLLKIAQDTGNLQTAIPIPLPNASLQKLLAHGQVLAAIPPAQPGPLTRLGDTLKSWGRPMMLFSFRSAVLTTFIIVAFLLGSLFGGGLTFAAQDSLPGEQIYPLKRLGETVRLSLTWNAINREKLQDTYNQRRLYETELLLKQGRKAQIGLTGSVEAINGNVLSLNGLIIQISPDTIINGNLVTGARVQIKAITRPPNVLIAITLTVVETGSPTPVFTPAPTITPTPSPIPTHTPSPTVSKVQTGDTLSLPPTATSTATPTATSTATPTATSTASPTAVPTIKIDNNNDNVNDNGEIDNNNDNSSSSDDDNSGKDNSNDDNSNEDDDASSDDRDDDNSGSGINSDNSGSGSSNSGSSNNDDNSGKGSSDDDKDDDDK